MFQGPSRLEKEHGPDNGGRGEEGVQWQTNTQSIPIYTQSNGI